MLKISRMADYAVMMLTAMGQEPHGLTSASGLAARTKLPEPTVAKVLKLLTQAGIVQSVRGARGGYVLALPLSSLTIGRIVEAIDGPVALTACVDGHEGGCELKNCCPVSGRWDGVNAAVRAALDAVSLEGFAQR